MKRLLYRKKKTLRIISWGGIGDAFLLTPSLKAIKLNDPDIRLFVYYFLPAHREVLKFNPFIDSLKRMSFRSAPVAWLLHYFKWTKFYYPAYGALYPSKFYRKSAAEIIAEMLDVNLVDNGIHFFLLDDECEAAKARIEKFCNPIVIQVNPGCSENKAWPLQYWRELIKSMPEYTFIQLGAPGEQEVEGAVNMLGLTLRESFAMVKYAKCFVGIDSCLAHTANAFKTPGVVLFGPSSPVIWGHNTNINLTLKLRCSPCIDTLWGEPCPFGKPCMDIEVQQVKDAILRQVKKEK